MAHIAPSVAALYTAIGESLNAWTRVEVEISTLFMVIHSRPWSEFTHPLRAAFEAVISLEARLGMIAASVAADPSLATEYAPHFGALHNRILKSYRKRHEVAHFATFGDAGKDGPIVGIKPFFTWANFQGKTGREPLFLKEINERTAGFYKLQGRVVQHAQHVGGMKGLPADYFAQAGDIVYPPLGNPPSAS